MGSSPVRGFILCIANIKVVLYIFLYLGGVSEWLKVVLWKPGGVCLRWFDPRPHYLFNNFDFAGVAQLVEHRPSKPRVASSSLVSRFYYRYLAQLVEHTLGKGEVTVQVRSWAYHCFRFFIVAKAMIS